MIKKRLIAEMGDSKKYIAGNVIFQWLSLVSNIVMMIFISDMLEKLYYNTATTEDIISTLAVALVALLVRFVCSKLVSSMGYLSSKTVKQVLRQKIYTKILRLGTSYSEKVNTAEVIQLSGEGVDQLETYFGAYLPQFFYSLIAPLTLFVVLCRVSLLASIVLALCVPLIPMAIVAVQKFAKKLLNKYWGAYTELGDSFLENLQGLTTLKIYQSDEYKNAEMNKEAEHFRKITMKVLTMQLNSITIMDLIAYGGAGLGVIISVSQLSKGKIDIGDAILIILLSADFFIPMRRLGSFFHVAMNGMAACDKIFDLIDLEEDSLGTEEFNSKDNVNISNLSFSYNEDREILHNISLDIKPGSFTAIAGESGCGKSTIANILMGKYKSYSGNIKFGDIELRNIKESSIMDNVTYISHNSYIFKGTVRDNLLMAKFDATDSELWRVLNKVNLGEFLMANNGLDTELQEKGSNLSGGQCQRLALARALLHNSDIYIFDEATSNIDVESENDIMARIIELAKKKTVIVISHRLANIINAAKMLIFKRKERWKGYIAIDGEKTRSMSEKKLTQYRRKHIGYVFQMYNLIPNLTVRENIEVGAYLGDNSLDVDEIMKTLGIYDQMDKLPNQLSGGQQQRTSIGRAIVKNPDILLCDEPTGALDYNTSKEILKLLEDVNKKYGNTIIIVTHNDAIKNMADKVFTLRDGVIRSSYINENKMSAESLEW